MQPKKKLTIKQIQILLGKIAYDKNVFDGSCTFENNKSNKNIETSQQLKNETTQTTLQQKNVEKQNLIANQKINNMQNLNLSAKQIWGKVVVMLREKQQTILHIVCGDITNIEKNGTTLVATTREQSVYTLLNQPSNLQILTNLLGNFGICSFKVEFVQSANNMTQNIEILKRFFDQNITIKE